MEQPMDEQQEPRCLTAEEILAANDQVIERVDTPEWGAGTCVYVRSLSANELDAYEESRLKYRGKGRNRRVVPNFKNARASFVAEVACDAAGRRLFTPAQVAALGEKNGRALARVFAKAKEITGISDEDLEEMEGN